MIAAINGIAQSWWGWMGAMLWQVSLLIVVVTMIDFAIRRWAWPQVRYALWLLVLIKLLIPPTWTLSSSLISPWQPAAQVRLEQGLKTVFHLSKDHERIQQPSLPAEKKVLLPTDKPVDQADRGLPAISSSRGINPLVGWKALAMIAWILGMGFFISLLVRKMARLRRWHRKQVEKKTIPVWYYELLVRTAERLKLSRLPAVVFSSEAKAPAVYGVFRPVLLLPAGYLDSLFKEDAEHVLLHELAHLKRGDLWLHGLCLLLQIIYWFNPFLIWMRRQMRHVREICCDLTVAGLLREKTPKYRETLLSTARELLTESAEPGMGLLGVFEDPFRLVVRLKWLEKKTWQSRKPITVAVVLVTLVMTAGILPMGEPGQHGMPPDAPGRVVSKDTEVPPSKDSGESKTEQGRRIAPAVSIKEERPGAGSPVNTTFEFQTKEEEPFQAVILSAAGPVEEVFVAMKKLQDWMERSGTEPIGPSFIQQNSNLRVANPEYETSWEVGYPVPDGTQAPAPFKIRKYPSAKVTFLHLAGTYDGDDLNQQWSSWLLENRYEIMGGTMVFCPDKLFRKGEGRPRWEIRTAIKKMEGEIPDLDIFTQWAKPIIAVILPMQGRHSLEPEALARLDDYLKGIGVTPVGRPFFRYFNDEEIFPEEEMLWEVGYPVPVGTAVRSPYEIKELPGGLEAYAEFECPPQDARKYYFASALRLQSRGFFGIGYPMVIQKAGEEKGKIAREVRMPARKKRPNPERLPVFY